MNCAHAVPKITIPPVLGEIESHGLMQAHQAEAQRIIDTELARGVPLGQALAKARRPIRAASRARVMYRAELAYVSAGSLK